MSPILPMEVLILVFCQIFRAGVFVIMFKMYAALLACDIPASSSRNTMLQRILVLACSETMMHLVRRTFLYHSKP